MMEGFVACLCSAGCMHSYVCGSYFWFGRAASKPDSLAGMYMYEYSRPCLQQSPTRFRHRRFEATHPKGMVHFRIQPINWYRGAGLI